MRIWMESEAYRYMIKRFKVETQTNSHKCLKWKSKQTKTKKKMAKQQQQQKLKKIKANKKQNKATTKIKKKRYMKWSLKL